jgi:hypothetical protein
VSAVAELTRALIGSGMDAGDAGALVARAAAELAIGAAPTRGRGAVRMEDYRDRREALGLPRIFRAEQYREPLEQRDGRRCIYCQASDNLVIDHIEPLFRGGTDNLGNLGFACRPCNGRKSGKALADTGMEIVIASAHIAHTAYQSEKLSEVNTPRTNAHNGEHVRRPPISTSSSNTQKEETKEEEQKEAPRTKRASRLPADWQLDQRFIEHAISKGIAPDRVPAVAEKFKNHFLAASGKGAVSPDWFRKWCNWCLNEIEWHGASNGRRYPASEADKSVVAGADRILERLQAFNEPIGKN